MTVTIYDKRKQLQEEYNIYVENNYLRYEIKLNSPTKIKKCLGTNEVFSLRLCDIQTFFSSFVADNIISPYQEHCRKRDIALKKLLKQYFKPADKKWVFRLLLSIYNMELENRAVPIMLDISELLPLIDTLGVNKQNRYNYRKRFEEETKLVSSVFSNADNVKYMELIEKLR